MIDWQIDLLLTDMMAVLGPDPLPEALTLPPTGAPDFLLPHPAFSLTHMETHTLDRDLLPNLRP